MSMPMRREQRGLVPDLFDWLDAPLAALRSPVAQPIKFEDYVKDGRYVLRAELPGVDPDKDVEITLSNGVLTVHAERHEEQREQQRTEFRYGSFTRSITLPSGIDESDVRASYDKGVLEINVKLADTTQEGKHIQIESTSK
ncbi:Hsp20/alpha crystallin family protein [Streptosporangium sp. NBC_01755]|uniref:Hsp20/alpha crystallin family protein n=1 Tax=unclassified Streptosporangium TaxID=2632669 RepID=UPI002DDC7673|nr:MULTISPECIES: Hsp20/alpha crystallin family protein [unclassified Streptosporangium]WSA28967.1 Hsp20/alpha crystallin family protein [Streptosporangium sp. NBC_01810]WSC99586.1 Hsp20/alpha crystallin family protein [Streptosporangium sp. NBC_01755]